MIRSPFRTLVTYKQEASRTVVRRAPDVNNASVLSDEVVGAQAQRLAEFDLDVDDVLHF